MSPLSSTIHRPFRATLFILLLLGMTIIAAACGGDSGSPTTATSATSTSSTTTAGATSFELGGLLSLAADKKNQSGRAPAYTIVISKPVLSGSDDPRVADFNQQVTAIFDQQVTDFQSNLGDAGPQVSPSGSSLRLDYSLKSPQGAIISLLIKSEMYYDGAAHPGQAFQTLTYDLTTGKPISLPQLFLPGVPYLALLADYCQTKLASRGELEFPEGAAPTAENYQNWVITSAGIEVTFGDYQVAPYSSGPQTVLVPYSSLKGKLDLGGPLGQIVS